MRYAMLSLPGFLPSTFLFSGLPLFGRASTHLTPFAHTFMYASKPSHKLMFRLSQVRHNWGMMGTMSHFQPLWLCMRVSTSSNLPAELFGGQQHRTAFEQTVQEPLHSTYVIP